jgi:hypothetical protein
MRKLFRCAMCFMLMFATPVVAHDESAISKLLHLTRVLRLPPQLLAKLVALDLAGRRARQIVGNFEPPRPHWDARGPVMVSAMRAFHSFHGRT